MFRIQNYQFSYPNCNATIAWKGDVSIKRNDRILLTGDSGAGKSTLLYALKGFFPETIYGKTSGKILYNQEQIETLSAKKKLEIGLLFQNPDTQIVHKKVLNELAFGLENLELSVSEMQFRIQNIAKKFQIEDLLERNVHTLSGGEKQKIALLSILLMNPQVLLLDEPTAFLDEESANHFVEAFYQIAEQKTIIIVEHNLHYLQNHVTGNLHIDKVGNIYNRPLSDVQWNAEFENQEKQKTGKIIWNFNQLAFSYGKKMILNVDKFTIYENEILGVMGKNGAGKTTFLKILAGLNRHYQGELLFHGKNQRSIKTKEMFQEVSLLFQNPENHFLFSSVLNEVSGNKDILDLLGLSHLAEKNPFNLSEGEKRRLSIGIQLSLHRNIFLMDEPTFGQDVENRKKLLNIIRKIRQKGCTFVIVSHDSVWLKAVCDRIVILENGCLHEA
jgi:energy-coupling factor transport system ATP-binding protein